MLQQVQTEITTFLLDKTQKETLEGIARIENTTVSEIIRTSIELFLSDLNFQNRILKGVKRR